MPKYRQFNSFAARDLYYYADNGGGIDSKSLAGKAVIPDLERINSVIASAETTTVVGGQSFFRKYGSNMRYKEAQKKAFDIYRKGASDAYKAAVALAQGNNEEESLRIFHEHTGSPMIRQGYHDMQRAWQNVISRGEAVYYDLEDLPDAAFSGRITEFSFQYVREGKDTAGTSRWFTEKSFLKGMEKGYTFGERGNQPHEYNSIIGSTEEQYRKDLKLLEKFAHGKPVTDAERVMLGRFAMMGHRDTHILDNAALAKRGVFRYSSFASGEVAVSGGMSETDIRLGIEQLRDIGRKQEASPLVKWRGFSVRGHEAEMLDALAPVIERDVTLIGHNIMAHDIPMLNAYARSGMVSDGFKNALKSINIKTNDGNIFAANKFDTLAALRTANADRMQLYSEPVLKEIAEKNLHLFSLEALGREYAPDFYREGKDVRAMDHLASSDTRVGVEVTLNSGLFDQGSEKTIWGKSSKYASRIKLKGGNRQLFMAARGTNISEFGLWGFRHDAFSNRIRTTDGFSIGEDGNVKEELFGQYLFQKEGTYTIQSIAKVRDKTLTDFVRRINPEITGDGLIAVTFNVVETGETEGYRFRSPVTVFGTEDKLQEMLNSVLYHVADENGNGEYEAVNDSRMRRDLTREFYDRLSGKMRVSLGARESGEEFAAMVIENATYRYKNEAASRAVREYNFKKDSGTVAFYDSLDAMEGHRNNGSALAFSIRERSEKLALHMSRGGTSPTGIETAGTLQSYLGYGVGINSGEKEIYTETVDAALQRREQIKSVRNFYLEAFKRAREKAGAKAVPEFDYIDGLPGVLKGNPWIDDLSASQKAVAGAYYRHLLKTAEDNAVLKAAGTIKNEFPALATEEILQQARIKALGEINRGSYLYQRERFEINLKGYKGVNGNVLHGINLNAGNIGMAETLLSLTGRTSDTYKDIDKLKELYDYQKWLKSKGIIRFESRAERISLSGDNSETAAAKILAGIKNARRRNPLAGTESGTFHIDLLKSLETMTEVLGESGIKEAFLEAERTMPRQTITDYKKASLRKQAEALVDNVLFDRVSKEELLKSGLSEETAEISMRFRHVRREDTIGFVEKLLGAVLPNGGAISYDTDLKKVFLLADGEQTELDFLPRDVYHNGVFYRKIGRTKTADMVGFYSKYAGKDSSGNPLHKLGFSSRTGYAAEQVGWVKSVLADYADRGKLTEGVLRAGKIFAGTLRETSSTMTEDAQDATFSLMFDMSGLIENIGELGNVEINTGNAVDDATLRDLIKKAQNGNAVPLNRLNSKQRQAVIRNEGMLIRAALGRVWQDLETYGLNDDIVLEDGTRSTIFSEEKFYYGVKHRGEGQLMIRPAGDYGQNTTTDKRGIHNQVSRAIQFNKNRALSYLRDTGAEDVRFGTAVSSALRAGLDTAQDLVDSGYEKTLRIKRLAVSTKDFRALVNEGIRENSFSDELIADMLSTVHLDEGSALIDPRIADAAFDNRNSTQMVKIDSVYRETDAETLTIANINYVSPEITVESDGRIRYKSGYGKFVKTGEEWIKKGSADETIQSVKAKYDGIMRFGVFDKGGGSSKLLSDQMVETLLNGEEARKYYRRHGHTAENAIEFLRLHTELAYYIRHSSANVNIKLASMGTEKGMYYSLMSKTGMLDRDIEGFLEKFGLEWMKDVSLSRVSIDTMVRNNGTLDETSDFAAMLRTASYRDTDEYGLSKAVSGEEAYLQAKAYVEEKMGGFGTLRQKLIEERNRPWREFSALLERKGFTGIHAVDNFFKGEEKHTDLIAYVNRSLDALLELDEYKENPEKLVKKLSESGAFINLSVNENGRIIAPEEVEVSISGMERILAEKEIDSRRVLEIEGQIVPADLAVVEYKQMQNYENARTYGEGSALGRSIRLNKRAVAVLSSDRYSETAKQRVKEGLKTSLGKDGDALYERYIAAGENGKAIASGIIDFLRESIYRDSEEGTKAYDVRTGFNTTRNGKVKFTGRILERFQEDGVSIGTVESMATLMAEKFGVTEAGYSNLLERYSAYSFSQADAYNAKPTEEKFRKIMESEDSPKIIRLKDLRSARDGSATRFLENIAEAQESMLDLHIEALGDSQIYSGESERYIYLPYSKIVRMNNEGRLAKDAYHKKLALLENMFGELNDRLTGENGEIISIESDEIKKRLDRMRTVTEDIRQEIRTTLTSKKGLLSASTTARLSDSGIYDAYGIQLFGNEESRMLKDLNFRGISLVEEAKKSEMRGEVLKGLNKTFLEAEEKWLKSGKSDSAARALMDTMKEEISSAKNNPNLRDGLEFDFTILDRKVMRRLYGERLVSELGLDDNDGSLFKESLEKQLTTGGTIALNIREPQDKAKSTSTTALFFGNTGGEDRALVSSMQQASKGGDFDSDKIESALIKAEAVVEHNGEKRMVRIDHAVFDVINSKPFLEKGYSATWTESGRKIMESAVASTLSNAAYRNKLYRENPAEIGEKVADGIVFSHTSFSADHLRDYTVEGTEKGTIATHLRYNEEESGRLLSEYQKVAGKASEWLRMKGSRDVFEGIGPFSLEEFREQRAAIFGYLKDSGIEKGTEEYSDVFNAVRYRLSRFVHSMEDSTAGLKGGAGEMNYHIFRYLQLATSAVDSKGNSLIEEDDLRNIMQVHGALGEAFLSPKNQFGAQSDRIEKLSMAFSDAYKAMAGNMNKTVAAENLKSAIVQTLTERGDKELSKLPGMSQDSFYGLEREERDALVRSNINKAADSYTSGVINAVSISGLDLRAYDITTTKGIKADGNRLSNISDGSFLNEQMTLFNDLADERGRSRAFINNGSISVPAANVIEKGLSEARKSLDERDVLSQEQKVLSLGTGKINRALRSSVLEGIRIRGGMAAAAVGIAAGLVTAGLASSPIEKASSPAPAETQAMGAAEYQNDLYSVQSVNSFADKGLNSLTKTNRGGYVININAQSHNDREAAIRAIQSAVGGVMPKSSVMNISMVNSYREKIDNSDMDRLIHNLLLGN